MCGRATPASGSGSRTARAQRALVVCDHAIDRVLALPPGAGLAPEPLAQGGVRAQPPHREAQRMLEIADVERDGHGAVVRAGIEIARAARAGATCADRAPARAPDAPCRR